jgi:hypothetical protein
MRSADVVPRKRRALRPRRWARQPEPAERVVRVGRQRRHRHRVVTVWSAECRNIWCNSTSLYLPIVVVLSVRRRCQRLQQRRASTNRVRTTAGVGTAHLFHVYTRPFSPQPAPSRMPAAAPAMPHSAKLLKSCKLRLLLPRLRHIAARKGSAIFGNVIAIFFPNSAIQFPQFSACVYRLFRRFFAVQ